VSFIVFMNSFMVFWNNPFAIIIWHTLHCITDKVYYYQDDNIFVFRSKLIDFSLINLNFCKNNII
jgi:hypothetical protein